MLVDWDEVQRKLSPIKGYDDLCRRLQLSLSYSFVRLTFNFSMSELMTYSQKLLGGDSRGRYTDYASQVVNIFAELQHAGVQNAIDLIGRVADREHFENFAQQSGISPFDLVAVLKYLIYWFIPSEKYLSGLVRVNPSISEAIKILGDQGIKTNLQLLHAGITAAGRKSLADSTRLPLDVITELVNRADFSRLPWASKATISNIIGAGYPSLAQLANANPDQLVADYYRYGKSIGKNLRLGNEIESSYRIAKIVPVLLQID